MQTEAHQTGDRPVAPQVSDDTPRRRHRWAAVVAAALMVAVLMVATAAGFRFVQSDPLPAAPEQSGPVIAVDFDQADGWPAAEVQGTLRLQDDCLLVDDWLAMFPEGTTWSEPDQVVFRDGTGWTVGQQIEGGGGYFPTGAVTSEDLGGEEAAASASGCVDALGLAGPDSVVLVAP